MVRRNGFLVVTVVILGVAAAGDAITAGSEHGAAVPSARVVGTTATSVRLELHGATGGRGMTVVAGPLVADRPVSVLVDRAYPPLLATAVSSKGIYDHILDTLPAGGWTRPVSRVDANGAAQVVAGDPHAVLVIASGAVPDTLLGPSHDFAPLDAWIRAGGELFFAGDGFLYWAAQRDASGYDLSNTTERVDWRGEVTLFGGHLVHDTTQLDPNGLVLAETQSTIGRQLGTAYRVATRGALLSQLTRLGGWDVGWDTSTGDPRTSLAVVPVGAGRVVLFGSGVFSAERLLADDVARVLLSGADVAAPVGGTTVGLAGSGQTTVDVPVTAAAPLRLLVADPSDFDAFHRTLTVTP